jgi:twitching motility protein PilT
VPRLDRLIQVCHEQRAEALRLAVGQPAALVTNGSTRALTRDPLTDGQIAALVREVADPAAAPRLGGPEPVSFPYHSPSGPVTVAWTPGPAGPQVEIRPAPRAADGRAAVDQAEARGALEELLRLLVDAGASDLHLRTGEPPLLRRSGELVRQELPPIPAERLEMMLAAIMTPREIAEFRETGDTDWAYEIEGLARFRCNAGRDRHGPMAVFRVIPTTVRTADEMGLSREVQNLCYLTKGLVVVTGPTGSGKSTTLAALIDLINRTRGCHIITVEDPIEYVHDHKKAAVNQREVGTDTANFPDALRSVLREDPDVLLVGEMRDLESIRFALTVAETGHLVFATLHTNDTAQSVGRMIDVFPAEQQAQIRVQLAAALSCVVYQRLIPRIGSGMTAAYEVLVATPAVRNLVKEGKTHQLRNSLVTGMRDGMVTLEQSLSVLVQDGVVSEADAVARSLYPQDIETRPRIAAARRR